MSDAIPISQSFPQGASCRSETEARRHVAIQRVVEAASRDRLPAAEIRKRAEEVRGAFLMADLLVSMGGRLS